MRNRYYPLAMAAVVLTASTLLAGVSVSYNSGSPWSPAVGEVKAEGKWEMADEAGPPQV